MYSFRLMLDATQHYSEELIKTNSAKDFVTVCMIQTKKYIRIYSKIYELGYGKLKVFICPMILPCIWRT